MATPSRVFSDLAECLAEAAVLDSCGAVLSWDQETYMPPGGAQFRARQLSLLAGKAHAARTNPRIGDLLRQWNDEEGQGDPDSQERADVREISRDYERALKMPPKLVRELSETTALAQHHWAEARRNSDFSSFAPWLEKIVGLKRQQAAAMGIPPGGEPYDALLEEYEPGATTAEVAAIFAALRPHLVKLVDRIRGATDAPDTTLLERSYPCDRQEAVGRRAAEEIGFDFNRGRLDVTTHPFCSGFGPGDCRLTTRYDERFFSSAFFGTLHEAGHGIYEQGLPIDSFGLPSGSACSLGIHESQSRLWENFIGRSPEYWHYKFDEIQRAFPDALGDVNRHDFTRAVNTVRPSLIRVEADEVTYNLHIMLRFDLERQLIAGDVDARDVPEIWNDRFQSDFGLCPKDDAEGCLQDVHWSAGLFGYFPTYALGNIYAAQLYAAADRATGGIAAQVAAGEFRSLLTWLRDKVHCHGRTHSSVSLVEKACGAAPDMQPLVDHLTQRAELIYNLS